MRLIRILTAKWNARGPWEVRGPEIICLGIGPIPTAEEIEDARAELEAADALGPVPESVTNRQLRLALIAAGIDLASIDAALAGNAAAFVEWEYATAFRRDHPLVSALAATMKIPAAGVDGIFRAAALL